MRCVAPIVLIALLPLVSSRAQIPLVKNRGSAYEIVVAPDAVRPVTFAASELQSFVERSTGVRLPIVAEPSAEAGHVFVGPNPASSAAGVVAADLPPEGFHLRTIGRDIHVIGRDTDGNPKVVKPWMATQCGTLYGVYELLERHVGVMFCWHDDLGTVVPQQKDIVIPSFETTQAPTWEYRALSYSPAGATRTLFGRRLRLGSPFTIVHSHNWFRICPVDTYGKTNPEYFAEVDGKRQARYYLGHHGGQVCTSNPAVIDLFVKAACDYFKERPTQGMFSMSPNDGGGFCECADCRALDAGDVDPQNPEKTILTDRMLRFYNTIATEVAKVHPDKLLGAYIYGNYTRPPLREKIHPSLFLVNATNSAHTHGVDWAQEQQFEEKWAGLSKHFVKYDIYYRSPSSIHLMAPVTGHMIEKIKAEQASGLQGGYLYIGQTYEQLGAGHYLLAKMMWDKHADARALERRYYNALYGVAGPDVLAYYGLLERRSRQTRLNGVDVDEPAIKQLLQQNFGGGSPAFIIAAYWPILKDAEALLSQARKRDLLDLQRQRLQRLHDHHQMLASTVRGMIASGRLEAQARFDPADVAMLKKAVEEREAAKQRMRPYAPTLMAYLERGDKKETARVSPDGAFYQLTRKGKRDSLPAVRCPDAPVLDGLGTDDAWTRAPVHYLVLAKSAASSSLGARAKVTYDNAHLYVFVEGREADSGKLLSSCAGADDASVFSDDNVEVFLQPPGDAYYHIAVGAGGGTFDASHPTGVAAVSDPAWESGVRSAVVVSEHSWSVEMALPFSAVGGVPGPGWTLNVYRTRRGNVEPDEYTAVSPTFGGYHLPKRFAELEFVDAVDVPVLRYGTLDDVSADNAPKRLRAGGRGAYTVELVSDQVFCGVAAAHLTVGKEGLGQITLTAGVEENTAYRLVTTHMNAVASLRWGVRAQAPITRVIFRGTDGKAVTETRKYSWYGSNALDSPGTWRTMPHVFTTPPRTTQISFTLFFHHPGEYWLDEMRLEKM